ncbi:Flp pilus assembly protein TadD [Hasllibacter halocynthiae]|uniref:Flp pilus assembly protein TadD n=1 Tax=Hasllibacter halocynthiae TaxID=595589 RepID=A0A2T0X9K7_9RHOB|nr:tetratricopeptide repeat protein [Hasllibacter halocynthiae]PRY95628.1 Flp pilus assembly protein TadD [Hasllibacter halocynthiae]
MTLGHARRNVGAILAILALSACGGPKGADVSRGATASDIIDDADLNDIMLTVGDPGTAVAHFARLAEEQPERVELRRGLAKSLTRAGRNAEAATAWRELLAMEGADVDDRVELAGVLVRMGDWAGARAALDAIPPTHETFRRYRLEAMVADSEQAWDRSDSFYETALGLTAAPAGVLNNWGFSKLSRGEHAGAERLLERALRDDPGLFTAKNNLALARAGQRNYTLPPVALTQEERAQLLHTMALAAIRQGDVNTGRSLLNDAVESHPRHFDAAARALQALGG